MKAVVKQEEKNDVNTFGQLTSAIEIIDFRQWSRLQYPHLAKVMCGLKAARIEIHLLNQVSTSLEEYSSDKIAVRHTANLAQRMNISSDGSRMAIIQYAETPRLEFALNQYTHPTQLEWAIQRINFLSGATNTGQALKLALDRGFDGARGGDIPKVAVVVTDGQSQ
ncbi:von Willebrand factor type A domain protein, partial [Ostertagia ostertagi]